MFTYRYAQGRIEGCTRKTQKETKAGTQTHTHNIARSSWFTRLNKDSSAQRNYPPEWGEHTWTRRHNCTDTHMYSMHRTQRAWRLWYSPFKPQGPTLGPHGLLEEPVKLTHNLRDIFSRGGIQGPHQTSNLMKYGTHLDSLSLNNNGSGSWSMPVLCGVEQGTTWQAFDRLMTYTFFLFIQKYSTDLH